MVTKLFSSPSSFELFRAFFLHKPTGCKYNKNNIEHETNSLEGIDIILQRKPRKSKSITYTSKKNKKQKQQSKQPSLSADRNKSSSIRFGLKSVLCCSIFCHKQTHEINISVYLYPSYIINQE